MRTTKRSRTSKKLVMPLLAIGVMTMVMYFESLNRPHTTTAVRPTSAQR